MCWARGEGCWARAVLGAGGAGRAGVDARRGTLGAELRGFWARGVLSADRDARAALDRLQGVGGNPLTPTWFRVEDGVMELDLVLGLVLGLVLRVRVSDEGEGWDYRLESTSGLPLTLTL